MPTNRDPQKIKFFQTGDLLRMGTLLGGLVLVLVMIQTAAQPKTWFWLTGEPKPSEEVTTETVGDTTIVLSAEDAKMITEARRQRDELRAAAEDESDTAISSTSRQPVIAPRPGTNPQELGVTETGETEVEVVDLTELTVDGAYERLVPERIANIRDRVQFISEAERENYFTILAAIEAAESETLVKTAVEGIAHAEFEGNADFYRGLLVSVVGELVEVKPWPVSDDEKRLDELYECWILPPDSDRFLVRVIASEIPESIPVGERLPRGRTVRATGYFFKVWGYPRADGENVYAPLILAKNILPIESAAAAPEGDTPLDDDDDGTWVSKSLAIGLVVLIGFAAFYGWRAQKADKAFDESHKRRINSADESEYEALAHIKGQDPEQFLKDLQDGSDRSES